MRNQGMSRRELLMQGGAVTASAVGANLALAGEKETRDQTGPAVKVEAEPYEYVFQPASTALIIIDMQEGSFTPRTKVFSAPTAPRRVCRADRAHGGANMA